MVERESAQQAGQHAAAGRREEKNDQQCTRHKTQGVVECESAQQAGQRAAAGRREEENDQQRARRETPGVVEHESAQQAAAREEPTVREHKSRQHAMARLNKTFEMACKYVNGQYIFHQPGGLLNAPCVQGCVYIHLLSSMPGSRKKCCANGCLSSASDNFDEELMMDHDLDKLPQFLRQVITLSPDFQRGLPHTTIKLPWQLLWCATIIRLMDSHDVVKVQNPFS